MKKTLHLLVVLILSFLITYSGPVRYLELKLIDSRFRVRGEEMPPDDIVVVAIDDETYSHLNMQFPYPRNIYAKLLENLKKAG
ncbi:adenylate/guanylate cyclase domain-containing protein, partial [bacterium]